MLEVRNVRYSYGRGEFCLRCADLSLRDGEFVALVGDNGSGKSTFLRLLLGAFVPEVGSITPDPLRSVANGQLLYVPSDPLIVPAATVLENLCPGGALPPAEGAGLLTLVSLDATLADRGGLKAVLEGENDLSGGERQRLGVARALAVSKRRPPAMVILDEAGSHLDPDGEMQLLTLIKTAWSGTTVIFATHRPEVAAAADRKVHVHEGIVDAGGNE